MLQDFIEFVKEQYILIVYFISLVISVFSYRKYYETVMKYFPIIIAYTFFNELLGYFIKYSDNFAFSSSESYNNEIIYNIYMLVFFGFFYNTYWKLISNKKYKRGIVYISILGMIGLMVNSIFYNPISWLLYYAWSIASIGLLICIALYKIDKGESWKWQFDRFNLMTWVSIGLILFYTFFPFIFIIGYDYVELFDKLYLRTVLRILIVIMYTLFCIGFIKSRRRAFR